MEGRSSCQEDHGAATGGPSGPSVRGVVSATGGASCTSVLSASWMLSLSVSESSNCTTRSNAGSAWGLGLVGSLGPCSLEPGGESAGGWSSAGGGSARRASSLGGVGGGGEPVLPQRKPNFLAGCEVAGETAAEREPFADAAQKPLRDGASESDVDASDLRRELATDGVEWCELEDAVVPLVSLRQSLSPQPALGFSSPTASTPVQQNSVSADPA